VTTKTKPAKRQKTKSKVRPTRERSDRPTPKVSPLRGTSVEDWVSSRATGWQQAAVRRILSVWKLAAPEGTIAIKWAQPVLSTNGPVSFVKVATGHVTLGFWRGSELSDPAGLLEGGAKMRHTKLKSETELDERALTALVREAVSLNREHGDPTRKATK
jgi:hypothetical protein